MTTNGAQKLYIGMHDGVTTLTSHDGGSRWQQGPVTPLEHAASRFAICPSQPGLVYLSAYESGVFRSDDAGKTWQALASYPSGYAHSVAVDPGDPDLVYVGSEPASIFMSRDGGHTWSECTGFTQVPEAGEWFFHAETRDSHVRDLRIAPHNSNWIYAGIEVGGIVRSSDGGRTWQQLRGTDGDVHTVAFSRSSPRMVYAATAKGPYRSDDQGNTWQTLNPGLEKHHSIPIAVAPHDHQRVLVAVASSARRKEAQAYLSTSGGRTWTPLPTLGSNDDMVVAFAWDGEVPSLVYAGTDSGNLYGSDDGGATWRLLDVKLSSLAVGALEVASA